MKKIIVLYIFLLSIQLIAQDNKKGISIENAYIKNVPSVSSNSVVFLTIKNGTGEDVKLIKVESDVAKAVELHNMTMESGIMKMRQVESILILANSAIELKPGGLHIMLIGLTSPLKIDDKKIFTFKFDNGKIEKMEIQVKELPQSENVSMEHEHHDHHHNHAAHNRADAISPAGIMAPHMHEVGKWMLDYRYMGMNMYGLQNGKNSLNEYGTLYFKHNDPSVQMPSGSLITGSPIGSTFPAMNVNSYNYMSVPTDMVMEMNMASVMTNVSENWMVMFMVPVVKNKMTMLSSNLDKAPMSSSGVGDVSFSAAHRFFYNENHTLYWGMGLSVPTGSIDERDWMPMMGRQKVPYNMQPGTGTFGLLPQFSYIGNFKRLSWGVLSQATLRVGKNDNHYRFGNRYDGSFWLSFLIFDEWSISFRAQKQRWLNISGSDTSLDPKMDPQNDPSRQGGIRSDAFIGLNFLVTRGALQGFRFGFEVGRPFQQNLNGPQLGTREIFNVFAQYSF
jgi:copper(I)-binding protein